jgi:hypothetical protein
MNSTKIFIIFVALIMGANSFGDSLPNPKDFSNGQHYYDDAVSRGIPEDTAERAALQYFPEDSEGGDEGGDSQPQEDSSEPSTDLVSRVDSNDAYENN